MKILKSLSKRGLALFLVLTMCLSLLPATALAEDLGTPANATQTDLIPSVSTADDSAVQIKKSVDYDVDSGKYTLDMEAFVTGTVTSTKEVKPTDIVLVLDQSGSMAYSMNSYTYTATQSQGWSYNSIRNSWTEYYYSDGTGGYHQVHAESSGKGSKRTYKLFYYDANYQKVELGKANDQNSTVWTGVLYTRSSSSQSKLTALKNAAKSFISTVQQNATDNNVDHKIAIVGFASGTWYKETNYDYGNTEVFVGSRSYKYGTAAQGQYGNALQSVKTQKSQLDASVNALSADGGTLSNLGLEMANGILDTVTDSGRNKVIVVFTDGNPGWSGEFETSTADAAIFQAQTAKGNGAKVYTIGVFGDDPSTNTTNYMNYMSSNYPNAESMNAPGARASSSYYMTATDTAELSAIFEAIANSTSTVSAKVDATAVLTDVMSPKFNAPTDTSAIRVYQVPVTGVDEDEENAYTWGTAVDITNEVTVNTDGKNVTVTGFDYTENAVTKTTDADGTVTYSGSKLLVRFEITPNPNHEEWLNGNDNYGTNTEATLTYKDDEGQDQKTELKDSPTTPVQSYNVTYAWENVPSGDLYNANGNLVQGTTASGEELTLTVPTDARHYISGQSYTPQTDRMTVYTHDEYGNVNGKYVLGDWTGGTDNNVVGTADVAHTATWGNFEKIDVEQKTVTFTTEDTTKGMVKNAEGSSVESVTDAGAINRPFPGRPTPQPAAGYEFDGWYIGTEAVTTWPEKVTENAIYTAKFVAKTDTAYKVEFYKQQDDGSYPTVATDTVNRTGTTGTTVSVTDADKAKYNSDGYSFDGSASNVLSATLAGDSSTVLKVYFKKNTDWGKLDITKELAGVERDGNTVAVTLDMKLRAGDELTYTITINNGTGKVLTNVKISEIPNENITLGTVKDQNGAVLTLSANNEITINSLPTGTTTLTVTATVKAEDALTGSAPHAANNVKIVDASSDDGDLPKPDPTDPDPLPSSKDDKEIADKVSYTVKWVEKDHVENNLCPAETREGYVGDYVPVSSDNSGTGRTFTGYTYNDYDHNVQIMADGTTVQNIYYTRNKYNITYTISYPTDFPEDAELTLTGYDEPNVPFGEQKDVKAIPTDNLPAGYHFANKWDSSDVAVGTDGKFNMPDKHVTFTLAVVPNEDASYTIEYYKQTGTDANGATYTKDSETPGTGRIGTTVSAPDGYQGKYTGYTYVEVPNQTLTSGVIAEDGTLVLKLYYNWTPVPVRYTVTVNGTPSADVSNRVSADVKPDDSTSHIGETVVPVTANGSEENFFTSSTAIEDTVNGERGVWKFSGWDHDDQKITAANLSGVTFNGSWSFEAYDTYSVTYHWGEESAPAITDDYRVNGEKLLPVDSKTYYATGTQNTSYTVDESLDTYKNTSLLVYDNAGAVVGEYQFSGWKLTDDVTAENVTSGNINGNVNLYGFWTPVEYGVTYTIAENANLPEGCVTGTQTLDSDTYAIGDDVTVANTYNDVPDVDNAGATIGKWVFSGWELNGTVVTGTAKMVRGGLAFTGSWNYVEAYKATYEYTGTLPTGLTVNSATHGVNDPAYYFNGTTVTPAQPMATSYTDTDGSVWTFKGWNQTSAIMTNGQARFTGTWEKTSNATTSYTVKYYFETLDGGYVQLNEYPDVERPGNTNMLVRVGDKIEAGDYEAALGADASKYELSRTNHISITLVEDPAQNVLEYYYDLKEFTVTYEFGPDNAASNPYVYDQLPERVTVKYGETITVPSADEFTKAPVYSGMYLTGWLEFDRWDVNGDVTITSDKTITGTWKSFTPTPNANEDIEVQKDYLGFDGTDYRWQITVSNVGMSNYSGLALKDRLYVVYGTGGSAEINSSLMHVDSAEILGGSYETSEPEWTTVTVIWQDQNGNTLSEKEIVELEIYETLDGVIVVPDEYYTAFDGLEPGEWGEPVRQADGSIVITWVLEPVVDPDAAAYAGISDPDNVDADDSTDNTNDVDVNDDIDTIDDVDDNDDVDNNDGADDADTVDNDDVTNDVEDDGLASEEDELSKALIAYAAAQMGIDLDNFDLLVGQTLVVEVSISERDLLTQVTQGGTHTLRNTALVYEENDPDPIGSDENDEAEITIAENPGIEVNKTASASSVKPGDTVTYTITVKNTGNVVLSNVVVDDPMMPNGGERIDTLAIDAEKQYTYSVVATESGTLVNTVTVTSGDTEDTETVTVTVNPVAVTYNVTYNLAGGSSSATLSYTRNAGDPTPTIPNPTREGYTFAGWSPAIAATVTRDVTYTAQWTPAAPASDEPSMSVRKTANRTTASVGDVITYTITVTNTGRVALTNIVVSDPMMANGSVTIATLAVGESRTITYTHTVTAAEVNTTLRNRVTVSGTNPNNPGQDDPDPKTDEVDTPIVPSVPVGPIGPIGGGGGGGTTTPSNPTPPASDSGETIDDEDVPLAAPGLNSTDHFDYVKGYEDGTVRPAANITRGEVATIFFRLMTNEFRSTNWSTESGFPDVISGTWYNNAVSTCVKAGLLHGYLDGTFQADQPITRAEFATIAAGFASEAVPAGGMFTDIEGHWAKEHIERAAAAGWIKGDAGEFRPDDLITRAEVITSINRMLDRIPSAERMLEGMKTFVDNTPDMWWYADVQEATNSHDYERGTLGMNSVDFTETWTELLPEQDWTALEKEWATAADANVVDVMVPASSEDEAGEPEAE